MLEKNITGYCDKLCAAPGEVIHFKVSCDKPLSYRADVVRILCGDDHEGAPGLREITLDTEVSGQYPGRQQPIYPGSCALVPYASPLSSIESFTVAVMAFPTTPLAERQVLISQWPEKEQAGFELCINAEGGVELVLGNTQSVETCAMDEGLMPRRWYLLAATYHGHSGECRLLQRAQPVSAGVDILCPTIEKTFVLSRHAYTPPGDNQGLSFAARWSDEPLSRPHGKFHYNGKLDSPRMLKRTLDFPEIDELFTLSISPSLRHDLVGWWDFSRDIETEKISDLSGNNLHGYTVQLPARAMTGYNWSGREHCWRHAAQEYGAVHFHDDDLIDAQWDNDFSFEVPRDFPSGIYAVRLREEEQGGDDYITFFIRPLRGRVAAKILFLIPSASYLAYSNSRLHLRPSKLFGSGQPQYPNDAFLQRHPELGGSLYDRHGDRSGVQYASYHRPIQNLKPKHNRPWGFPADTNIADWLDHAGFDFDVLTDEELHCEGYEALRQYQVVITGTHPEYHSTQMLDALDGYLRSGGRLVYMGGNGFYWRIAFHPARTGTIEVRRAEDGTRAWIAEPGEYYHSFNGEYGGLWRRLGRPPNQLVGVGFAAQGFASSTYYRKQSGAIQEKAAFVFAGVPDEVIGNFGSIGGGAAGEEIDRYARSLGSPPHAIILASSENHDAEMLRTKEEFLSTVLPFKDPKVRADMVLFETENAGAVFATGSITWAASLSYNHYENNVAYITRNVVQRFLDPLAL